jgi:dinuclear metal center YbgI/SA1388 family protein
MADLHTIVVYLEDYLRLGEVRDAVEAMNGLQVGNKGAIHRIASAVDLCEATIAQAAQQGADLLLVHHGLFWGGLRPLTGPYYRRVVGLVRHDIAVYSAHLPLDCHPEVGNAAVLARLLDVRVFGAMNDRHGQPVGIWGECHVSRDNLSRRLAEVLGAPPRAMTFGPDQVRRIGIVTGAGGSLISAAAAMGLDTYLTGEGAHHTFFDAEELGLNVFYGGHYRTETFGVKALGEHLAEKFSLPCVFLDHPTEM